MTRYSPEVRERAVRTATYLTRTKLINRMEKVITPIFGMISCGTLASTHSGLVYVFQKPYDHS